MQFSDIGYIIKAQPHAESSVILTVLTSQNGKLTGYVKNGLSKKRLGIYQIGNSVNINAYSRLEESMYSLHIDLLQSNVVAFLGDEKRLSSLSSLCELCNICIPEKDNIEGFYNTVDDFFKHIHEDNWLAYYSYFEFYLLDYLGIGLDLSECAATGAKNNLKYVSPKSGKAISEEAGKPYASRLFAYPQYIVQHNVHPKMQEINETLQMTEFFLNKNFFQLHGLKFPENRASLRNKILNLR